ncbi:MAG TPA: phosphonate ABC transporter, permease protein PhnE [Streptosporangiaceae bacterium]|jgi:phosphonate transport system permease protein
MRAVAPAPAPEGAARTAPRPPWTARRVTAWVFPLAFTAAGLAAAAEVGLDPVRLVNGFASVGGLLARSWPPTLTDPMATLANIGTTTAMAVAGTALGLVLALVLAVLAARPTSHNRYMRSAAMAVIVGCRAIPDVVFAFFFVAALGIGPLPGVLALGLHSIGMLGKLATEAIERTDDGVREAVAGTGAGPLQRLVSGVLPQIMPNLLAVTLYRVDMNFRTSVLLGAVGAGGIGLQLSTAFGFTDYREATGLALVTVGVVLLLEAVSAGLRLLLLGRTSGRGPAVPPVRGTRVPWTRGRVITHAAGWAALAAVAVSCWSTGATPAATVRLATGTVAALGRFWPPSFGPVADLLGPGLAETCAIAMAATFLGVLAGLMLGLAAARGVLPGAVYGVARGVLVLLRSIPDLLLVLVFVAAFGLVEGAMAGACALAVCTAALVGKLVADSAEEVRVRPREAIRAAGAGRVQELASGLIGPMVPALVGNALYALDVNLRAFFVLGVVGAGELGFAVSQNLRLLNYDVVTAIVLPVFALVLVVEVVSTLVRGTLR